MSSEDPIDKAATAAQALLRHRTISSAIWLLSGTGVQALLRLLVLSLLARMLSPAEFGLAAAALIVIGFFQIFLQTGIRPAVIQRPELTDLHIRCAFTLALALGFALAGAVAMTADWLAVWIFDMPELAPILSVVALILPLQSLGVVAAAKLERDLDFSPLVQINVLSYALGYGMVGVTMAWFGYGVWALVGAYIGQELVKTVLALLWSPHSKRPSLDPRATKELVFFGFGFSLARMGNFGALNGDKWVVARWLGRESLGFYKYAFELTAMVSSLFGSVLDRVLFPAMSRFQNDRARLGAAFCQGVGMVGLLVFPTSAILIVAAPEIIRTILGDGWDPVIAPFRVLCISLPVSAMYTISDSLARATGVVYKRAWRQFVFAAVVLILAWYGQRWGLVGLAVGVGIATALNQILMLQLSRFVTDLSWWDLIKVHVGALPAFVISGAAAYLASLQLEPLALPDLVSLSLVVSVGGLAMLVALKVAPSWVVGVHGLRALSSILEFADDRFPALIRNPVVRAVLPIQLDRSR